MLIIITKLGGLDAIFVSVEYQSKALLRCVNE